MHCACDTLSLLAYYCLLFRNQPYSSPGPYHVLLLLSDMISCLRTQAATTRAARTGAVSARPTPARSVVRRYKEGEHDVVHEANKTLSGEWPATWALKGFEVRNETTAGSGFQLLLVSELCRTPRPRSPRPCKGE